MCVTSKWQGWQSCQGQGSSRAAAIAMKREARERRRCECVAPADASRFRLLFRGDNLLLLDRSRLKFPESVSGCMKVLEAIGSHHSYQPLLEAQLFQNICSPTNALTVS